MNIYCVDGNVGAGKSTVMEYMHKTHGIPVDLEPVSKWQPYLEDMYYRNKGSFEFQVRVWMDRCWIQSYTHTTPMLMERSPLFQRDVFVPINYKNGRISEREYTNLLEMYNKSMSTWSPKGYIYIRSDPEKCYTRIHERSRTSEEAIPLEYIKMLHEYHEETYAKAVKAGFNIVVVDMEGKTVEQVGDDINAALDKLGWKKA